MKLENKTAVITGGSSGIGLATARLMISEGARVAIVGRDQEKLHAAAAELGGKGGSVLAIGEDAADSSFAGLYHTSLNVKGCDAVVRAIQRCWQSHGNATSRDYREHRMIAGEGAMAVMLVHRYLEKP